METACPSIRLKEPNLGDAEETLDHPATPEAAHSAEVDQLKERPP